MNNGSENGKSSLFCYNISIGPDGPYVLCGENGVMLRVCGGYDAIAFLRFLTWGALDCT